MILFGTRGKRLEIVEDRVCRCPSCGQGPMAHNVFQQYFHIWYIPVFPIGRKVVSKCLSCGKEFQEHQLPPANVSQAKMNVMKRTPVWTFAGLFLIAIGAIALTINDFKRSARTSDDASNPELGYAFLVKDEGGFMYYQVAKVNSDSIFLAPHSAWFSRKSDATISMGKFNADHYSWLGMSMDDYKTWKKDIVDAKPYMPLEEYESVMSDIEEYDTSVEDEEPTYEEVSGEVTTKDVKSDRQRTPDGGGSSNKSSASGPSSPKSNNSSKPAGAAGN